jgi:hypothetical protein
MKKIFPFLLGLIIIIQGCQTNSALTEQQKDEIIKAVKERNEQFWAVSFSNSNESLEKTMALFVNENDIKAWKTEPVTFVSNLEIVKTPADMANFYKKRMENRTSTSVKKLEDHFAALSKDKVLEFNKVEMTMTLTDGTTFGPIILTETFVWVNMNGVWKILHLHESFVLS